MSEGSTNGIRTRRYAIPRDKLGDAWGFFVIDDRGFFAVVSDCGNYAYQWTAPGQEFRKFLCELEPDYLAGKLKPGLVYDGEKTEQRIREYILRLRREQRIEAGDARREYDGLDSTSFHFSSSDFVDWMHTTTLPGVWNADLYCYGRDPQTVAFCERLYPRFVEALEAELADESRGEVKRSPSGPDFIVRGCRLYTDAEGRTVVESMPLSEQVEVGEACAEASAKVIDDLKAALNSESRAHQQTQAKLATAKQTYEDARARAGASWEGWDRQETERELEPWPKPAAEPESAERPEWLKQLRGNLHTQDNRITAHPIFVVQQRVRVYGLDPHWEDGAPVWLFEGDEYDADDPDQRAAEAVYNRTGTEPDGWSRTFYRDSWEFVTACFTEAGCNDYLEADGHNLTDPRIYVDSARRNREWQLVRELLGRPWPGDEPINPITELDAEGSATVLGMLCLEEGDDDAL